MEPWWSIEHMASVPEGLQIGSGLWRADLYDLLVDPHIAPGELGKIRMRGEGPFGRRNASLFRLTAGDHLGADGEGDAHVFEVGALASCPTQGQ